MKARTACIPCIMHQAYNTAKVATNDVHTIRKILDETAQYVQTIDLDATPADLSNHIYDIVRTFTGIQDPYEGIKKQSNEMMMALLPELREKSGASSDTLNAVIRLAIMGNLIDYGIKHRQSVEEAMKTVFEDDLGIDDYTILQKFLAEKKRNILYIGDNAGEIVMDVLLVEQLLNMGHTVTYVVKRGPIINDATMEDAEYVGMEKLTKVIDTGSDGIGVKWSEVSEAFISHYNQADLIVSKGQGNYETLSDVEDKPICFMLRTKCDIVADELDAEYGQVIIKCSGI